MTRELPGVGARGEARPSYLHVTDEGRFNAKIRRYPDRLGRTVLWVGASALYGVREHPVLQLHF